MQIVIDIDDKRYKDILRISTVQLKGRIPTLEQVIANGTPQSKQGHWRHYEGMLICSECDSEFYDDIMEYCGDDVPKCCPNCGLKMEEVAE